MRGKIRSVLTKDWIRTISVLFIITLIFSLPLKYLLKLSGGPYLAFLVLSGLIAYVNAKLRQVLMDRNKTPTMLEFILIFIFSICLVYLTTLIGYPLLGCIISSSGVFWIIPWKTIFFGDFFWDFFVRYISPSPLNMTGNGSSSKITDKSVKGKGKEVLRVTFNTDSQITDKSVKGKGKEVLRVAFNTDSPSGELSNSGSVSPHSDNLPPFIIPGINIDLKTFSLGSLWPGSIHFYCVFHPYKLCTWCAWDWIPKQAIPFEKQSHDQLQNIIAHVRGRIIKEEELPSNVIPDWYYSLADLEVIFMEVLAEYRRRLYLRTFTFDDPKMIHEQQVLKKLDDTWMQLYNRVGKSGPYRENWERGLRSSGSWYQFEDAPSGVPGLFGIHPKREESYQRLLEDKEQAVSIARLWDSLPYENRSMVYLNEIKATWEKERAAQDELKAALAREKEKAAQNELKAAWEIASKNGNKGKKRAWEGSSQDVNRVTKRRR